MATAGFHLERKRKDKKNKKGKGKEKEAKNGGVKQPAFVSTRGRKPLCGAMYALPLHHHLPKNNRG